MAGGLTVNGKACNISIMSSDREQPCFIIDRGQSYFITDRGQPYFITDRGAALFYHRQGAAISYHWQGAALFYHRQGATIFYHRQGASIFCHIIFFSFLSVKSPLVARLNFCMEIKDMAPDVFAIPILEYLHAQIVHCPSIQMCSVESQPLSPTYPAPSSPPWCLPHLPCPPLNPFTPHLPCPPFLQIYAIIWLVLTWSPYPWSLVEITPVLTTFCGYYPYALLLCSVTHYDITMAHEVARDAPLWHNNE